MREWKNKIMEEMTLHSICQTYEEKIETQRGSFQVELEKVGGKLEQLEFRSNTLENKVRALRSSEQSTARSPPLLAATISSGSNLDKKAKREIVKQRLEKRS